MSTRRPASENLHAEAAARALAAELGDGARSAAWRDELAEQDAAYRDVLAVLETVPDLRHSENYAALMGTPTLRERLVAFSRQIGGGWRAALDPRALAAVATLVVAVIGIAWLVRPGVPAPLYRTDIAQLRALDLPDGSKVTLGARSALKLEFKGDERRVALAQGEAFFDVAHDAARPFVVIAGDTRITVTGTRFNVKLSGGKVRVAVLEGSVRVAGGSETSAPPAGEIRLAGGEQAVSGISQAAPVRETVAAVEPGGWRGGWLSYQDASLEEIVADANRYRTEPIRIGSAALARSRLTTSFRAAQIDAMVATLPETLPLRVERRSDGSIDLIPR